jgi:predicted metal-dependent hydrolase
MTKQGSINLNVNLLKTPEDVIDYIILHELCHFKIKGTFLSLLGSCAQIHA